MPSSTSSTSQSSSLPLSLCASRLLLWNWLLLPHQDTRLLPLPLLPDARLQVRPLLREAVREELDPLLRLSLLLQTMGFCGQRSPPRRWIRMTNRRFSQSLEVALCAPLLCTTRAVNFTIRPAEHRAVRSFLLLHAATFRHRLALT